MRYIYTNSLASRALHIGARLVGAPGSWSWVLGLEPQTGAWLIIYPKIVLHIGARLVGAPGSWCWVLGPSLPGASKPEPGYPKNSAPFLGKMSGGGRAWMMEEKQQKVLKMTQMPVSLSPCVPDWERSKKKD